jgi:glyoxylase I family protein
MLVTAYETIRSQLPQALQPLFAGQNNAAACSAERSGITLCADDGRMTSLDSPVANTTAEPSAPPLGGVHHFSLTVTSIDASVAWYRQTLGLVEVMNEEHAGGRAVVLMHPNGQLFIGLHAHAANAGERFEETRTGLDHISIGVPSRGELEAWERRLRDLGVPYSPIYERSYGALLVFRDPDNIQLELISPLAQA